MKRNLAFLFLLIITGSCNNDDKKAAEKKEDDVNVVTAFLRSALDGKFDEARTYLLSDSANAHYMDVAERNYEKANTETKNGYRGASILIHGVDNLVKDSVTVVIYSNSFKNDHDTLKIVKAKGQWRVDLKYLYEHDMDTTHYNTNHRDTLK